MRILVWWIVFTALCIWAQSMLPGLDCFAPAVIVLLHLQRQTEALWLTPAWIVINEGAGTLAFGLSILWLGGLILIFVLLRLYLSSSSHIFLLTLSLIAGIWHAGVVWLMCSLQELRVLPDTILLHGLKTALFFPLLWVILQAAFTRWGRRDHVST